MKSIARYLLLGLGLGCLATPSFAAGSAMGLEIFVYAFLLGLDALISAVVALIVGKMASRDKGVAAGLVAFITMIIGFSVLAGPNSSKKEPPPLSPQQQKNRQG